MYSLARRSHGHIKDPVVHVRFDGFWNTKIPKLHCRLGSATLSQLAFPGKNDLKIPWEKSQLDDIDVERGRRKKRKLSLAVWMGGIILSDSSQHLSFLKCLLQLITS